MEKLTQQELMELYGCVCYYIDNIAQLDILNHNTTDGCLCTYSNNSTITNKNTSSYCHCQCN